MMGRFGEKGDMVTEYHVTSQILEWLKKNDWEIVSYDYPQSGTGFALKPDGEQSKNKHSIIPDIVCARRDIGLMFENKDRFDIGDFDKINALRTTDIYRHSISVLFGGKIPKKIWYGIGFPHSDSHLQKAHAELSKIDFLITLMPDVNIKVYHNPNEIQFLR